MKILFDIQISQLLQQLNIFDHYQFSSVTNQSKNQSENFKYLYIIIFYMQSFDKEQYNKIKKIFSGWKIETKKMFIQASTRLKKLKIPADIQPEISTLINKIHKEIVVEPETADVGDQIEQLIDLKKFLKNNEMILNKAKEKEKKNQKKIIHIPQPIGKGLEGNRKNYLKFLYRSFLTNSDQEIEKHENLEPFLKKLQQAVYSLYDGDQQKIAKQLKSIQLQIESEKSLPVKKLMLQNKISPKQIALNKTQTYQIKKLDNKMTKDQEPTDILDGKGQECPKCRAKQALCYHMQQIRGADEPMTRFMRCKACKQSWNDQ